MENKTQRSITIVLNNGYRQSWTDIEGEFVVIGDELKFETKDGKFVNIAGREIAIVEITGNFKQKIKLA